MTEPERRPQRLPRSATTYTTVTTPVGPLTLTASPGGLSGLYFENRVRREDLALLTEDPGHPVLSRAAGELHSYFLGSAVPFSTPVALEGTGFQMSVWHALQQIPHGETTTYGAVARAIGNPNAVRAVGLATGANPVSIFVPCHRVVGKNGALTGFGGGLERKRHLLELEAATDHTELLSAPTSSR